MKMLLSNARITAPAEVGKIEAKAAQKQRGGKDVRAMVRKDDTNKFARSKG